MAIPKYNEIMIPLLKRISDSKEYIISDLTELLAQDFGLTDQELKELLPSGQQTIFANRVGWARTYLKKAKLLEVPRRGFTIITERGKEALKEGLNAIDRNYLMKFEEFRDFQNSNTDENENSELNSYDTDKTPEDLFEYAHEKMNKALKMELLDKIIEGTPYFFERLVIDLLINMGYGGSRKDAGKAFTTSGDGGIDGIVKEDRLGLDVIYVQAKKWKGDSIVGRPEIQKFAGALQGVRAKKGVFITTSRFSKEAEEFASNIESKIILIDGDTLTEYMIESNTGVSLVESYHVKRIDGDYFLE